MYMYSASHGGAHVYGKYLVRCHQVHLCEDYVRNIKSLNPEKVIKRSSLTYELSFSDNPGLSVLQDKATVSKGQVQVFYKRRRYIPPNIKQNLE